VLALPFTQDIYQDPDVFVPERFLDPEVADIYNPRKVVFGFGRRLCPGRHFADASIWLAAANIIATLDISKVLDPQGKVITPSAVFKPGLVSHPEEFVCKISPRTPMVSKMVSGVLGVAFDNSLRAPQPRYIRRLL